jgi:hypothetical protein
LLWTDGGDESLCLERLSATLGAPRIARWHVRHAQRKGIHMDPLSNPQWYEEGERQRLERDLERSELEREVQGDGAAEKRRSPLAIVAWIVAAALAVLACSC